MVSRPAPALTKLSFRRDVKLFLTVLVGYLVVVVLILLLLLQASTAESEEYVVQQWNATADEVANTVAETLERGGSGALGDRLIAFRGVRDVTAIRVDIRNRQAAASGFLSDDSRQLVRTRGPITITVGFDDARLDTINRRVGATAIIALVSVAGCVIFLIRYLPTIVRPIEELLDEAARVGEPAPHADETDYLVETFRRSVETLQRQEQELQRLHTLEKQRADDLEVVTATLTRSLNTGFLSIDAGGRVLDMNAAGKEILHIDTASPVERTLTDTAESPFWDVVSRAFASRSAVTRAEVVEQDRTIGLSAAPLLNDRGAFLGMIVLFSDLTGILRLEARLRELDALANLGEMAAGIAHEFRNSLSTILGYLKLARRCETVADFDRRLAPAEEEAALLSRAVDALLAFARPLQLESASVDLMQITRDAAARLSPAATDVSFHFDGGPLLIDGDAALLERAVSNILRNSIDAIRQKGASGTITIRATAHRLEIADDGIGFDPADAPRLLLPFQSDKPSGLGLGLALTRKIVLLHGATLHLTGQPGHGATVTIEFPARE